MKTHIENGKLVIGECACSPCNGTGETKIYDRCPNYGKKMKGQKCEYCGSKNRHDHKYFETYKTETCANCNGTGIEEDDTYNNISKEELDYILSNVEIIQKKDLEKKADTDLDNEFLSCCYSRVQYWGATDYEDHRFDSLEKIKQKILKNVTERSHQRFSFYRKVGENEFVPHNKLIVWGYDGGYSGYFTS